mmetsp:Transcript_13281/g.55688  ORF Transcript_13281/g.55688 Transcript_13281/m.55688 type:complete len:214 (-) Transcript_13281:319-960(-)
MNAVPSSTNSLLVSTFECPGLASSALRLRGDGSALTASSLSSSSFASNSGVFFATMMSSYASVSTISRTSKGLRGTCDTSRSSSCSAISEMVTPADPLCSTSLQVASRSMVTKVRSNSWSVHHAPPVMSRLGSSSNSMYTLRFLLCTDLTALITWRPSSDLRILDTCGCWRLQRALRSRIHIPWLPCSLMIWRTSSSSLPRPCFLRSSSFASL